MTRRNLLDRLVARAGVIALGAALLFASPLGARAADTGTLRVEAVGLRSDGGTFRCAIYASADGYPTKPEKARARVVAAIKGKAAVCEFPDLPPGIYAVAAYHDENGNGKLDSNFIGIPTEGVAASNDAKGSMGPPRFDDARVNVKAMVGTIKVTLRY